jgi:FKBP-type peptidyl-prolyl cis-trans isomerase
VTFFDGTTKLGTGSVNSNTGIATYSTSKLALGTHTLTAVYGGASTIAVSTSTPVVEHINPPAATTTALTFSAPSVTLGQIVTLTATVTSTGGGTPTGTVTFTSGATTLGTAAVNSSGIATLVNFAADANITATYSGDKADAASHGSNTLTGTLPTITTISDGLQVATLTAGTGSTLQDGQIVNITYTGYLLNGTSIGTNVGGTPLPLTIGSSSNIKGFNEGIAGMKLGETRLLIIPAALAFGSKGQSPNIPPNATIIYTIQALSLVPRLEVLGGTGFSLSVPLNGTPSAINGTNFRSVAVNTVSQRSAFAVLNSDPSFNLTFKGVFANSDTKDFIVTQPQVINGTYTFYINFKPFTAGVKTATITIPTSDTDVPSFTFTVTGIGV